MLSGESLTAALHAIATGYPDRAQNLIHTTDELDDHERELLRPIVDDEALTPAERIQRLGDVVRELGPYRDLANECYRSAFYVGDGVKALTDSPLFAYFSAHRSGRLIDKWVHYFPIYERHLARFRGTAPKLLEIGVSRGGSLDLWESYLGATATVVGIDIDPDAARLADPRLTVLIGDQADREFLASVVRRHGPFDIVIDDGGHTMEQQIASIETLFPALNDDGLYLVEDCHTSYWDEFGGGLRRAGTFIEWVKERVDDLHGYHQPDPLDPVWTVHVEGIHCYDSVVAFEKRRRFAPFCEQAGTSDFIFYPRATSALVGEMLATRDAAIAERDVAVKALADLHAATADEWRLLRGELASLKPLQDELGRLDSELSVTLNDLLEAWDQLKAIRNTVSWRITAPLRALRRRTGSRP